MNSPNPLFQLEPDIRYFDKKKYPFFLSKDTLCWFQCSFYRCSHSISTLRIVGRQRGHRAPSNQLFCSCCFIFVSCYYIVSRVFWSVAGATAVVLLLRQGCRSGMVPTPFESVQISAWAHRAWSGYKELSRKNWHGLLVTIIFHLSLFCGQEQVPQDSLSGLV